VVVVDRCGGQRKVSLAAIDVISSGVQNGSNPLVFRGYKSLYPYPYPGVTRDITRGYFRTRDNP